MRVIFIDGAKRHFPGRTLEMKTTGPQPAARNTTAFRTEIHDLLGEGDHVTARITHFVTYGPGAEYVCRWAVFLVTKRSVQWMRRSSSDSTMARLPKNGLIVTSSEFSGSLDASVTKTPLTDIAAKFERLATGVLPPAQIESLVETVRHLEDLVDASELARMLVPPIQS